MTWLQRRPVIAIAIIAVSALAAPMLPLPDPLRVDTAHPLLGPSWAHWLGQDGFGRDVLSRLWWGGRTSLAIATISAVLAGLIGIGVGLGARFLCQQAGVRAAPAKGVMHWAPPLVFALLFVVYTYRLITIDDLAAIIGMPR